MKYNASKIVKLAEKEQFNKVLELMRKEVNKESERVLDCAVDIILQARLKLIEQKENNVKQ